MTDIVELNGHILEKPLISVCIVTYNHQRYIRDAVMSVLAQVNPAEFELEILVGDDFSTDSTPVILQDIVMQHPECITVLTHSRNVGGCENYLALLRLARGNFVAHLDGDDYWLPGKLSAQLAFLNKHQKCTAVYTNAVVLDAEGILVGGFSNDQPEVFSFNYIMARGNFLNHSSLLYRRCSLESLRTLQAPFIDYMIHLRLALEGDLGLLPAAYVVYHRATKMSVLKNQFNHFDDVYLQTIITMATDAPESVRNDCCATYIVNTLGVRPAWCREKSFWKRVQKLMLNLRVQSHKLVVPIGITLFRVIQKTIVTRLAHFLYPDNSLIVVHARH